MDLRELSNMMGMGGETEARHMRSVLNDAKVWELTMQVPEAEWLRLLKGAVALAKTQAQNEANLFDLRHS